MSNPQKSQGTSNESDIVDWANKHPRVRAAWRLSEGGSKDPGDVAIETWEGDVYVVEAKHRERLNIHKALAKHLGKVERATLPVVPAGAALQWKRTVLKEGNVRRSADGLPEVFVLTPDEYLDLITR